MKTYSGISDKTPQNLLLDTGAFFVNFDISTDTYDTAKSKLLGATSGGGKFTFKPSFREPKIDGAKAPVRGLKILESWEVTMGAGMLELKKEVLQQALAISKTSATTINSRNYTKIEGKNVVEDTDYINNITWIGTLSGSNDPVIIQVFNALNDEGLKIEPKDNDDIVCELNFVGHSTTSTLETPPFAIYYPTVDTTPPTVTSSPADAATAVAVTANVVFTFSEAIDPATVTQSNFMVMKASDGTLVVGTLAQSADKLTVTFDPTASLTAATPYIAVVSSNVRDLAGNYLASNLVVNFTTA